LKYLGNDDVSVHVADINFDLIPCPTPKPTKPPSEKCPTTKDKCKFYENDDGTNFCSDIETCPPSMIWEAPNGENKGLGCSKKGGNEPDCGCCRVPPPTTAPTPPTTMRPTTDQCPETPESCECFDNEDCTNFCSDEPSCPDNWIWDEKKKCDKEPDNDKSCRCCRKPPPTPFPTPHPSPRPTGQCPTTNNKCKFYKNDEGSNFCSDIATCPPSMIWESPDGENKGLGCSTKGDNQEECGCCRVPEPTRQPTPFPSQPDICKLNVTKTICIDVLNGTYCPASNPQ